MFYLGSMQCAITQHVEHDFDSEQWLFDHLPRATIHFFGSATLEGKIPFSLAKILHSFIGFGTLLDLKECYLMLYICREQTMGTNTQVKNKLIMFFPLN